MNTVAHFEQRKDLIFRGVMLGLLKERLNHFLCDSDRKYCQFLIKALESGYEEHFNEVLEYLRIEPTQLNMEETKTIRSVLFMYEDIHKYVLQMTDDEKALINAYLFSGFSEVRYHGYYLFLQEFKEICIPCTSVERKPLEEYLGYLKKYEHLTEPLTFNTLISIFEIKKEARMPLSI